MEGMAAVVAVGGTIGTPSAGDAAPDERRDLMARFLFWNYRYDGPDREELLARLIQAEAVDVAILVESSVDRVGLIDRLRSAGRLFSGLPIPHGWV